MNKIEPTYPNPVPKDVPQTNSFHMEDFDPRCEYFALTSDGDGKHYTLYGIGDSTRVTAYKGGFLNPDLARAFLCSLPDRLYYFKEHPPILVRMKDLKSISSYLSNAKEKSFDKQLCDIKSASPWCYRGSNKKTTYDRV